MRITQLSGSTNKSCFTTNKKFLGMLLGLWASSLMGSVLAGKGVIRADEEAIATSRGQGTIRAEEERAGQDF